MKTKFLEFTICLVALHAALPAASAEVPVGRTVSDPSSRSVLGDAGLGLVFDAAAGRLRPVNGVPGAAHAGPALDLGMKLAWAAVSPLQDYVLAASPDSGELLLFQLRNGVIARRPLPGAPVAPDRIALSPTGASAALYYAGEGVVRILSDFEGRLPVRNFELLSAPQVMAVSDDGQAMLVTVVAEGESRTLLWTGDGGVQRIFSAQHSVAAAFLRRSQDAVIADAGSHSLYRLHTPDRAGALEVLAEFEAAASAPAALSLSSDNQRLFVVAEGRVDVLDLGRRTTARLECACDPAGLTALSGSLFRLTDGDGQRFWLLDGGAADPRIIFVPLQPSESEADHE